jgi:hypothetical protein
LNSLERAEVLQSWRLVLEVSAVSHPKDVGCTLLWTTQTSTLKMEQYISLKCWDPPTRLYGVVIQKTTVWTWLTGETAGTDCTCILTKQNSTYLRGVAVYHKWQKYIKM